jgi:5-methyltetrahydrofolate--homocysteine methyltransferase
VPLIGLGSTKATPSKEIEAIKAADFLMDNDASGGNWIRFNKPPASANAPQGARRDREGRRRRRA